MRVSETLSYIKGFISGVLILLGIVGACVGFVLGYEYKIGSRSGFVPYRTYRVCRRYEEDNDGT